MDCPRCDATQPEPVGTECARCGIVFAKVKVDDGHPLASRVYSDDTARANASDRSPVARAALIGRSVLCVCVLVWTWRFVSQPMGTAAMGSFLHGVNLAFHEAGHILFLPVGAFLTALGGSLMQLLVPSICLVALVRQNGDAFGGSLALWWMGENLLDLAPYIADAVALELVLLGGFTGREVEGHDWEAILGALGWLDHASVLGQTAHVLGVVVMVGASIWGALVLAAQQCPQFRGPNGAAIADGADLPDRWSREENVAWVADIAGAGWSSPIVWGNRVYVTSALVEGDYKAPSPGIFGNALLAELVEQGLSQEAAMDRVAARDIETTTVDSPPVRWVLQCLDATTGSPQWSQELYRGQAPGGRHRKNSYASETPVTDGERVYVHIGNVGLFVLTMSGDPVWSTRFDPYPIYLDFGTAASVAVDDERVYVLNDNLDRPFLTAFDKRSGTERWTVERDPSGSPFPSGWASPLVWRNRLRTEFVTVGLGYAISYDAEGNALWRLGGLSGQPTPTPVADERFLYVGTGAQGGPNRPLFAVRPGASGDITLGDGESGNASVAWLQPTGTPYVPSPLIYRDRVYSIFDNGILNVFDARTGGRVYRARVGEGGSTFAASPWAADGKVYLLSEEGDTFVIEAGDAYTQVAVNSLDELAFASLAVADGGLFIRTMTKLYRIHASQ